MDSVVDTHFLVMLKLLIFDFGAVTSYERSFVSIQDFNLSVRTRAITIRKQDSISDSRTIQSCVLLLNESIEPT